MMQSAAGRGALRANMRFSLALWLRAYRSFVLAARPVGDLIVRIFVAQAFIVPAMTRAGAFDAVAARFAALGMSAMTPETAATGTLAVAVIAPLLLVAGLFTRVAALALIVTVALGLVGNPAGDSALFLYVLLGWYVVHGADLFALDSALRRGLSGSPLPLAAATVKLGKQARRALSPLYLTAMRIWLAAAIAGLALVFVPWRAFASIPPAIALAAATLLLLGLATPVVSVVLLSGVLGMQAMAMMGAEAHYAPLPFALLALYGPGRVALDRALVARLERDYLAGPMVGDIPAAWPHVMILGAGFGGLACAAKLRHLPVRVTLVDRNNYHLFQPLLYQIATANLSPGDIALPIRGLFRHDPSISVLLGAVSAVDTRARSVTVGGRAMDYDMLVVATGATHSYFGKDEWAAFAPGLKRVEDGVSVRGAVLSAFERAEAATDAQERERLLTFVLVGGGPTGVELAGALAELARFGLKDEYRNIDPAKARIILVQSAQQLLPTFAPELAAQALETLTALGVDVRLGARVTFIDDTHVKVGEMCIETETVLWAAGVVASPAAGWLGVAADKAGRVVVEPDLSVGGHPDIFAIGDTAASMAWAGEPVPGLAPAAKQGGHYVAKVIRNRLEGRAPPPPFVYKHLGSLATIGRKSAVADFGRLKLTGAPAWWLWGAVHLMFLVGGRNRAAVVVNWIWSYITYRVGVRLITGELSGALSPAPIDRNPARTTA